MEKKIYEHNFTLPLVAALVVLVILLCVYFSMDGPKNMPDETTPEPMESTTEPIIEDEPMPKISFKSDLSAYESAMTASGEEYLMLVNKSTLLPSSYKPQSLSKVKDTHKDIELETTAQRALEAMFIEMRACGIKDAFVTSAYRSYEYQYNLFYNVYIPQEQACGLSYEEAKEKVLTYSALPGTSEHHTGLAVDLMTNGMRELDESFENYPVFDWLSENAWKFGFILRYPKDKVATTGYDYEPWHYRFVGREAAYEIWRDGLCLEEYLAK